MLVVAVGMALAAGISNPMPTGQAVGQRIVENCAAEPKGKHPDVFFLMRSMYCKGYLSALVDELVSEQASPLVGNSFCNGPSAGIDDYKRVVLKYYKQHPEQLRLLAAPRIKLAIKKAFPCRQH